jgi:hypothetical protein
LSILGVLAHVVFVYCGASRGVNEQQAVFLADALNRRALFAVAGSSLSERIRHETAAQSSEAID